LVDQADQSFAQTRGLVQLKLGDSWSRTFGPNSNLSALISASAQTLTQLSVRIEYSNELKLVFSAGSPARLNLRTLSLTVKTDDVPNLAQLFNACPTIETLIIESSIPEVIIQALDGLSPVIKLSRLIINLRKSLLGSAVALTDWLALPGSAGIEVLVVRGPGSRRLDSLKMPRR